MSSTLEADVLVVGGGGAGLRAAIEAGDHGSRVILISKGEAAKCGASPMAGADLTLDGKSLNELGFKGVVTDNKEKFFNDIITQSYFLGNQKLVKRYVEDAPKVVEELIDWGMRVDYDEERAIDTEGFNITHTLLKKAEELNVKLINDVMFLELLTSRGTVSGGIGLRVLTGEFIIFKAKAVVIATGGWHKAYIYNAGSRELAGDGLAIAYRAGASLGNMEFVTFCCNVTHWPPIWNGSIFTYILHSMVGGELVNTKNERFLDAYDPEVVKIGTSTEWNKSFVSIATYQEILNGNGTTHSSILYTLKGVSKEKAFANVEKIYPKWRYKGTDFSNLKDKLVHGSGVEVGPSAEYFEGGIVIDEKFSSTLNGLFAAGEATMSIFGANRVVAATTEMLVEGAIAGGSAATYANGKEFKELDQNQIQEFEKKIDGILSRRGGNKPSSLLKRIQTETYSNLGPIRTEKGLEEYLEFIENAKEEYRHTCLQDVSSLKYNKELIEILELENILTILELSANAALIRTESRGVHYRSDIPITDNDNWLKEIIFKRDKNSFKTETRSVDFDSIRPPEGKLPYFDMMKMMMKSHSDTPGAH
ncbi:MAG: FAD-binding protein [Thermoplasmatales archaeon]|jgi:succinate dehydrogenase/fumarate reductase flavoprotein subunit|nr:FAD-binding protein [Thermoplasmatales archaeon]